MFDSRSGRTFTYATPCQEGDLSVSALGLLAPLLRQGKGDLGGTPPETIMAPIMFSEDLLEAAPPRRLDHVLLPVLPPHFALGGSRGTLIGPFLASLDDLEALLWPNFRVISAPGDLGPLSELGLLAGMSLQTIRRPGALSGFKTLMTRWRRPT